jgi:hypothetical protein
MITSDCLMLCVCRAPQSKVPTVLEIVKGASDWSEGFELPNMKPQPPDEEGGRSVYSQIGLMIAGLALLRKDCNLNDDEVAKESVLHYFRLYRSSLLRQAITIDEAHSDHRNEPMWT